MIDRHDADHSSRSWLSMGERRNSIREALDNHTLKMEDVLSRNYRGDLLDKMKDWQTTIEQRKVLWSKKVFALSENMIQAIEATIKEETALMDGIIWTQH